MFEAAEWQHDRMSLNGWLFRIDHARRDDWDAGPHFRFYKTRGMVHRYERFFSKRRMSIENMLELGMWDGGSLAFWCETLKPKKAVGIDVVERTNSDYLDAYVAKNGAERIRPYWCTDQM